MTLISVSTVARRANILEQVLDEEVGTGDNSVTSFDLDNDNVITDSLTLSYAADGSNDFTALVVSTDYTVDLPSGKVLLTSAGKTALSTNVLYATYNYLAKLSETQINSFISASEARMKLLTGICWEAETLTEFYDGHSRSFYPVTDRPFQRDRPEWDSLMLDHHPVTGINEVYFLDRQNNSWDSCQSADGSVYTDNTSESNTASGTAFNVFADTPVANDAIYFGLTYRFLALKTSLQTLGTDAGSLGVTWEYYNGSSWASLSTTASVTGVDLFTATGGLSWTLPNAWAKTTVNGSKSLYFVRARMSAGSYTAVPKLWEAYPDSDTVLVEELSPRNVNFTRYGRVTFLDHLVPDGVKNIRIKYTAGVTSSDDEYQLGVDLANCLTGLMCAVAITGGSFDDETSFTLGPWAATIGEVYVNVREVVNQLQSEIKELKRLVGDRNDIV